MGGGEEGIGRGRGRGKGEGEREGEGIDGKRRGRD